MFDKPLPLFLLVLLASMLGSFLANVGFPREVVVPAAQLTRVAVTEPKVQMAQIAEPVTPELRPQANRALQALLRADISAALPAAKLSIAEYYMSVGSWPRENAQAGLPAPEHYQGRALTSLTVRGNALELRFASPEHGLQQALVSFFGEATPELAMGIRWSCSSADLPDIAEIADECRYTR